MAVLTVSVVLFTLGVSAVRAESRRQRYVRGVGNMQSVGGSGASTSFRAYSYGVGGLARPSTKGGSSVLRSDIGGSGSYSVRRKSTSALVSGVGGVKQTASVRLSSSGQSPLGATGGLAAVKGAGLAQAISSNRRLAVAAAADYMSSLQSSADTALASTAGAITSLAPSDESLYSDYLTKGEKAFKAGNFDQAYRDFRMANHLATKDPESLLSLAHASFAKSTLSYAEASHYLRSTLKRFPELPLAALKPKAFFGDSPQGIARYANRMARLEEHVSTRPNDLKARLLLVYFRWFEGQTEEALKMLRRSVQLARNAKDADAAEAFDIFIDAVEAGGVSVAGAPTTRSARISQ